MTDKEFPGWAVFEGWLGDKQFVYEQPSAPEKPGGAANMDMCGNSYSQTATAGERRPGLCVALSLRAPRGHVTVNADLILPRSSSGLQNKISQGSIGLAGLSSHKSF